MSDPAKLTSENESNYVELNATQRVEALKSTLEESARNQNSHSFEIQEGSKGSPHYLWIRGSNAKVLGLGPGTSLVYDTGLFRDKTDPKIHLNVSPDHILEVIEALAKLQDNLFDPTNKDEQAQTFTFKVAIDSKVFGTEKPDGGWPPRIVVYPSSFGLHADPDTNEYNPDKLNEDNLTKLVTQIEESLEHIHGWKDENYRARYNKKLESFSSEDESIEVVIGNTAQTSDNSGR